MLTTTIFADGLTGLLYGVAAIAAVWYLSSKFTRKIT